MIYDNIICKNEHFGGYWKLSYQSVDDGESGAERTALWEALMEGSLYRFSLVTGEVENER